MELLRFSFKLYSLLSDAFKVVELSFKFYLSFLSFCVDTTLLLVTIACFPSLSSAKISMVGPLIDNGLLLLGTCTSIVGVVTYFLAYYAA
jgi:hypothetical protein